jgi:cytochrome P450/NADPH-cytochrome P450 reductase
MGGLEAVDRTEYDPPGAVRRSGEVVVGVRERQVDASARADVVEPSPPQDAGEEELLEIPYAVRWLVPKGERWANFPLLNDNDTQLDYYRRFGHIYAVGIPTKKWRLVVVSDPELLDEVAANEEQFGKRVEEMNFFAQLARTRGRGTSVIGDGPEYEHIRRVMLPWYSPQNQRTQFGLMKDRARKLVTGWSAVADDEPVDARKEMERYALEVSGRGACNYDFGLLDGESRPLAEAVIESTKESIARVAEPRPDFTLFARRARRKRRRRYLRHNRELFRTADLLVRGRQHTCPVGQQNDLLTRLLTVADPETGERLDLDVVRDQILMHLSNGFNGPSITGGWLAYVLATHPEVEEKLLAEIDSISGGDPDYDLQLEDLMRLPYVTQVIKETLRIYPPMPVTIRRSLADGRLGRYRIRKGDVILVGTLAAQRDPRYWGPDPDRFDPDQFAMERVVDRPRHAFIPFSVGKRQCMAQEVTFMMLRVVLFEIYNRYRLRLAPGASVAKNTVVTTKPVSVPVVRLPRGRRNGAAPAPKPTPAAVEDATHVASGRGWDRPSEIPETSAYRHLVVAYGSNFGTSKELAERFADRSRIYGFTHEVVTLNELAAQPPRSGPWVLVVMTPTYTSNPPANAVDFKQELERAEPGAGTWRNCRYLVWGLGNSQWNAFLAFPRYVHTRLEELGAAPVADFAFADVGSPVWEEGHAEWNERVWPLLLELAGARPTEKAAERVEAERSTERALKRTDSNAAMAMSLLDLPAGVPRAQVAPRVLLVPEILANPVGIETVEARVRACRDLHAAGSPKRTRHLELTLPTGFSYRAGDHLGVCPRNDEERVERLAARVGAALDGLFMVPLTMDVRAVPKGVVLQVRNVLTSLVDITGAPPLPLLDLLVETAADPAERARLEELRALLRTPNGAASPLRAVLDAGGYDVLRLLDEFPSCSVNLYELLQVLPPLRPRYYSTSSTPRVHGDGVVHLTIGLETAVVPDEPPREFRGVCGGYLHSLREGDRVTVFHDGADGFHLQGDVAKPMLFVSVGTGFAPMRAFLWERAALKRHGVALGEAALFHGLRSRELDYIYRDEIESFAADGVLDHLHVVASRETPDRREHVQDRLRAEGELVWRLLEAGGYVYVCGSQPMRDGVRAAFVDVVAEHTAMPREHAEAYLYELETVENRYRPDLWG